MVLECGSGEILSSCQPEGGDSMNNWDYSIFSVIRFAGIESFKVEGEVDKGVYDSPGASKKDECFYFIQVVVDNIQQEILLEHFIYLSKIK